MLSTYLSKNVGAGLNHKGQSAVEYLMTYGWMLLVVAIVGGATFSLVQDQNIHTVSGFAGQSVAVNDFGTTSRNTLDLEIRNTESESVQINSVTISDGEKALKTSDINQVKVGQTKVASVDNIAQADSLNSYEVTINYTVGDLENLEASGTISGGFLLNGTNAAENTLTVETLPASEITSANATLNGNVTEAGSETPDKGFSYGVSENSLDQNVSAGTTNGAFSSTLEGLESNTTYYYKALANTSNQYSEGSVKNFTTSINTITEYVDSTKSGDGYKTMWSQSGANVTSAELELTLYQPTTYYGTSVYFDQGSRSDYEYFGKKNSNGGDNKDVEWRNESTYTYRSGNLGSSTSIVSINVTENGDEMTAYFDDTGDTVSSSIDNFNRVLYDGDDNSHSATLSGNITYYTN